MVAHESEDGYKAQSRSNSIYLFQPPLLHVPNAFTKNYDGLNETWGFVPVFVKTYHMQVYTRWGEKVFETNDIFGTWDGTYKGKQQPIETYVYYMDLEAMENSKPKSFNLAGNVTIIR